MRCTWLRHESSANRCQSQPRLTVVRRGCRQNGGRLPAECGIAGARRIVGTGGRRKLGCTATRLAERQRIIEAEASRIAEPMAVSVSNTATQAVALRRHRRCSSSRLPIETLSLGGCKGGYSLSSEREYPPLIRAAPLALQSPRPKCRIALRTRAKRNRNFFTIS